MTGHGRTHKTKEEQSVETGGDVGAVWLILFGKIAGGRDRRWLAFLQSAAARLSGRV